jgi:hypothetical protein
VIYSEKLKKPLDVNSMFRHIRPVKRDDSGVRGCERANVLGYETDFIPCGITSPILRIYDIMPARCQVAVSWHVLKIEHLRGNDLKIEHLRGNDLKIELCQNCSKNRSEFYFRVKIDVVPFLGLI